MAKGKKKSAPAPKEKVDPNVLEEYWEEVSFMCPKRGLVKQKIKVKRLKPRGDGQDMSMMPDSDLTTKLDNIDDGLEIYGDTGPSDE